MTPMSKTVFVLLVGTSTSDADAYQVLQQETAEAEGKKAGITTEIVLAPGFDQLRVLRERLVNKAAPLDAVIVEPVSITATGLILNELKGRAGLVLLNAWAPEVEERARDWGKGLPFGTVSTDHRKIGEVQGRQVAALLPRGGHVLCVTGPRRSSAAVERLEGTKAVLPPAIDLLETEAGRWMEGDGIVAFDSWYAQRRGSSFTVDVIAAHSDELAMGARSACRALTNAAHREMLLKAPLLGVDACPSFGRRLVDEGRLTASVVTPATTGDALWSLRRFWESGQPLSLRAFAEPRPYPPASVAPPS
jgi:ABC-type sugar transport system substrate-binding protein